MNSHDIIAQYVERARAAQKQIQHYTQKQIDEVCVAIGWEVYCDENIDQLAQLAVEESRMGNVADKITKHKNKVLGVLKDVQHATSVGCIEVDEIKKIKKYAKPVGVVGALTPVTNPTATPSSNGIAILKGRNAVIFAPHPRSKKATALAVQFMRDGLAKVNAPLDLIQVIDEPSIELTNELMKQVDVVLATGGGAMVKAAYSSGKPAYGVGPGNAVTIIAEDADVKDAVTKIMASKTFDNATSCSSENSVIIHASVMNQALDYFKSSGAVYLNDQQRNQLEWTMWPMNKQGYRSINPDIIAQDALSIATLANLDVPSTTKAILVKGSDDIEADYFSQEKLSPVLTVFSYDTFEEGYRILERLTDNYGTGHSCGIHTFTQEYVEAIAQSIRSSRVLVNQAQAAGNGGAFFNGMPSTVSLGCGSWGGNITSENITYKHFLNVTWVSEYFTPQRPSDDEIFGSYLKSRK